MTKSFKDQINPAMNFISQESINKVEGEAPADPQPQDKAPKGYKLNHLYIETKSERLQLLIQPSLKAKLKEIAKSKGTSVNNLVNQILSNALERE